MATTLADIRRQYPYYAQVPDQQLADALYAKYYGPRGVDRAAFDNAVGYKPYDNPLQAAGKALYNLPGQVASDVVNAGAAAVQAGSEAAQALPDQLLSPDTKQQIAEENAKVQLRAKLRQMQSEEGAVPLNVPPGINPSSVAAGATTMVGEMAPAMGAAVATGGLAAPAIAGAVQGAGAAFGNANTPQFAPPGTPLLTPAQRAEFQGFTPDEVAQINADTAGAPEGQTQTPFIAATPEGALVAAAGEGAVGAVANMVSAGPLLQQGIGVFQRALTEAAVNSGVSMTAAGLNMAIEQATSHPDLTLRQIVQNLVQAGVVGGVAGAVMGGVAGAHGRGTTETPATPDAVPEPVPTPAPAPQPGPTAIENSLALPAPEVRMALPPPAAPDTTSPFAHRPNAATPLPDNTPQSPDIASARIADDLAQAREAIQRTRQTETQSLLAAARQTITPLGTFTPSEVGGDIAQQVNLWRSRTGRNIDQPITVEDMANAKVPQAQIDSIISARRPVTGGIVTPEDVASILRSKNIVPDDTNFQQFAYRTTGARDLAQMNQTQLGVLKSAVAELPAQPVRSTLPIADQLPFTEGQYSKAVDAIQGLGRYTLTAIKDAIDSSDTKLATAIRDAMVRRGQLVQRGPGDYRLFDVLGAERQPTPDQVPPGAFTEHVVREMPVGAVRIRQDGKSIGRFNSVSAAGDQVSKIRAQEVTDNASPSQLQIEPAGQTAFAVLQNRYDAQGNYLGQVAVDSYRNRADAEKVANQLNNPDTGARYTQVNVTPPPAADAGATGLAAAPPTPPAGGAAAQAMPSRPAPPPALEGRLGEVVGRLTAQAEQRGLPLLGTRVRLTSRIPGPPGEHVEASHLAGVIRLATAHLDPSMSTDEVIGRLGAVMDHELIHALKESGVLEPGSEAWKTLAKYARTARRPNSTETYHEWARRVYKDVPGYESPESVEEEAIAEAFRHWAVNQRTVVGKPRAVFRQLVQWFQNLIGMVPHEVFRLIETGRLVREALTPKGSEQPRAKAARAMNEARQVIEEVGKAPAPTPEGQAAKATTIQTKSREFIRARAQAREDRYGRSGPKTVLGTTPDRGYAEGELMPREDVESIVKRFADDGGSKATPLRTYLPEDAAYMKRVADAQEKAAHNPKAPGVAKAYSALADETRRMFQALKVEVAPWRGDGAPYATPAEMMADIKAGRLKMRLSGDMFGPGAKNPGHPMNRNSGFSATDNTPLSNNDLLRAVHDVYGHGRNGFRSTPRDAYNAYHEHARLLSPEARRALATETLAQDAWQNYGAHMRRDDGTLPRPHDLDYLPPEQREFAEQKAYLLPQDLVDADPGWARAAEADATEVDQFPQYSLGERKKEVEDAKLVAADQSNTKFPTRGIFDIEAGDGDKVGRVWTKYRPDTKSIWVNNIVATRPLSPKATRSILARLQAEYPEAQSIGGVRMSGARMQDKPEVTMPLKPLMAPATAAATATAPGGSLLHRLANFFSGAPPEGAYASELPGGQFYGKQDRSPGAVMSKPDTPPVQFSAPREGNKFFAGDLAGAQLDMARTGERGAVMIYLRPEDFALLAGHAEHLQQEAYNALVDNGYRFNRVPSIVIDGFAGKVRVSAADGAYIARALEGRADRIPVAVFPKSETSPGNINTLEGRNGDVPWPAENWAENFPDQRATTPRYSINDALGYRVPEDDGPPAARDAVIRHVEGRVGQWLHNIGRADKKFFPMLDARIKLQDKMLAVKDMLERVKAAGGDVNDANNIYMLEQLYHGKAFEEVQDRENRLVLPLLDALKAAHGKVSPKDLEDYLYARHAPERNAYLRTRGARTPDPSGMSDAEAHRLMDGFAKAGKMETLGRLADMVDAITRDTTETRVAAGLISRKAADSSPYENYVPLRGIDEEDLDPDESLMSNTRARSGRGFSVGGREDRGVTGRSRKAGDLLGHVILQNTEAVIRAEKNDVAKGMARLIAQNPDAGIGKILAKAPTRLIAGDNGMIRETGDPSYRQRPDIVTAKMGGREIIMQVTDPRVARALKGDYVASSNDIVNGINRVLGGFNRYLANLSTSFSPDFLLTNPLRDLQEAAVIGQQYGFKGFARKIATSVPSAMNGIREVLFTGQATGDWARLYEQLKADGGTVEFMGINDLNSQVRRIRKAIETQGTHPTARQVFDTLHAMREFVENTNKILENGTRLATYRTALDAGLSRPQAAYIAKNITVNFNKGGEWKTLFNSLYLFYNAGLQGTANMLGALKSPRVQKIVAGIVAAGAMQDVLNRLAGGQQDENKNGVPDYDEIPSYILEHNMVWMDHSGVLKSLGLKNPYLTIPLPPGFGVFYNLGRNIGAMLGGNKTPGAAAMSAFGSAIDSLDPLGGSSSFLNFIAPTIADPLVDLATNRDFAGNPIVPNRASPNPAPVPNSQRYWTTTGEVPKWIASQINKLTGGDIGRAGALDWSPEQLDYVYSYLTGTLGRSIERAATTGADVVQGDYQNIDVNNIPIIRRFVGNTGTRGNANIYYDNANDVFSTQNTVKAYQQQGDAAGMRAALLDHPAAAQMIPVFTQAEKALQDLRAQLRQVRASTAISEDRRRAMEQQIKDQQDAIMARANQLYFTTAHAHASVAP